MGASLDVYFDYRSPFAYMVSELLPPLADRHGASLVWKPIDLLQLSSFAGGMPYSEKKRAYVFVDVVRQAEFHALEIQTPDPFPVRSELALRVALATAERPGFDAVHRALFHAAWRERRDLASPAVLMDCLRAGSVDPEPCLDQAKSSASAELLTRRTREADEAGVFGVPTLSLEGELFWGVDTLPVLDWRLASRGQTPP